MFADAIVDIYYHFQFPAFQTHVAARQVKFDKALRTVANYVGLPMPRIEWFDDPLRAGFFDWETWTLALNVSAATDNPCGNSGDSESWLSDYATAGYHELRHCEQQFLMLQAMVSGALPIPTAGKRGREVLPHGTVEARAEELRTGMGYPNWVVDGAYHARGRFSQSHIPQVRGWLEKNWGRGQRAGVHTVNRKRRGFDDVAKERHHRAYQHLADEADAFTVQAGVMRIVRERLK
jgi:hypothetical protein